MLITPLSKEIRWEFCRGFPKFSKATEELGCLGNKLALLIKNMTQNTREVIRTTTAEVVVNFFCDREFEC